MKHGLRQKVIGVSFVAIMAFMGCSSLTATSDGKTESEWVAAYTSDFANAQATEDNWFCAAGGMKCSDGRMALTPGLSRHSVIFQVCSRRSDGFGFAPCEAGALEF